MYSVVNYPALQSTAMALGRSAYEETIVRTLIDIESSRMVSTLCHE